MERDITKVPADAIGNIANSQFADIGCIDGVMHRAGRPAIMRELDSIRTEIGITRPGGKPSSPVRAARCRPRLPRRHPRGSPPTGVALSALLATRDRKGGTDVDASCGQYGHLWPPDRCSRRNRGANRLGFHPLGGDKPRTFVLLKAAAFAALERAARDDGASAS